PWDRQRADTNWYDRLAGIRVFPPRGILLESAARRRAAGAYRLLVDRTSDGMSARRKDNGHVRQARSLANGCADRLADFRHHHAPASVHGRVDDLDAWDRDRSLGHVRQSLFARSRVEELPGANTQGATLEEA